MLHRIITTISYLNQNYSCHWSWSFENICHQQTKVFAEILELAGNAAKDNEKSRGSSPDTCSWTRILELAGNAAKDNEKFRIIPRHLHQERRRAEQAAPRSNNCSGWSTVKHPGCAPAQEAVFVSAQVWQEVKSFYLCQLLALMLQHQTGLFKGHKLWSFIFLSCIAGIAKLLRAS